MRGKDAPNEVGIIELVQNDLLNHIKRKDSRNYFSQENQERIQNTIDK